MASVAKAVIPAAGRGTRSLPASKVVPKELLPVIDKPAIQYVVEEAVAAGLGDVALIVSPSKASIAAHFEKNVALEEHLEAKGAEVLLDSVRAAASLASFTEVVQDEPRGLGNAVACAEDFVAGEAFAVMLADDLVDERDRVLDAMIAIHETTGGSVVLLLEVTPERVGSYGSVDPLPVAPNLFDGVGAVPAGAEVVRVARAIEKPAPGEEYSNFAIVGRYVFTPAVFDALRNTTPGRGGEIQLTDAVAALAEVPASEGGGVYGLVFRGRRYDTGDVLDYLKATVQIAAARPDLGSDFTAWLRTFIAEGGRE